jgi:hypothetical protein
MLSANPSFNPGVSILTYEWDLDGDSIYETNTGTVGMINFTFLKAGIYVPRVRITDNEGAKAENTITITVH